MPTAEPTSRYSPATIDTAETANGSAGIPTTIVLNKTDLPTLGAARERLAPYKAMGVAVLELSLTQATPQR